ncbi:cytochrome P450 [Aspergillus californicus]
MFTSNLDLVPVGICPQVTLVIVLFIGLSILVNALKQAIIKEPSKPPLVFHWLPIIGSTITYGRDPLKFFQDCKEKYGDVFTFILLGRATTVCLGPSGNNFVLNGKHSDLSAEEVYSPLTTPVFGSGVVFDCSNAKLLQQKKFVKFGLTADALKHYVELIALEAEEFIASFSDLQGTTGTLDVPNAMSELTIYTASRSLQGKEVRAQLDSTVAGLFHDLDMGFTPINFMMPWAPLPQNRARDRAQRKMTQVYLDIIQKRRAQGQKKRAMEDEDMIWNLMSCQYKDGSRLPDKEIAHMMIALLLGGHHSSSATISYILLQLASHPEIQERLYEEQLRVLGSTTEPITYDGLQKLTLNQCSVRETLRLHNPVHSILRQVKRPLVIDSNVSSYVIPPSHLVLASPASSARDNEYFPDPLHWDPQRWEVQGALDNDEDLNDTKGSSSKGSNSPFLPFGGGRHRCIGEKFAYVQLGVILALLVRHFKIRQMPQSQGFPVTDYSVSLN